jgi:hypothetical protein
MVLPFDMGDVPDFVQCFVEVLGWSVGFWVLGAYDNAMYASPFHVFVIIMSVEWRSTISLDHLWEAMGGKDSVQMGYNGLSTGSVHKFNLGYQEYSSVITSKHSLLGNGPQKSMSARCHGLSGSGVGLRGSRPWYSI